MDGIRGGMSSWGIHNRYDSVWWELLRPEGISRAKLSRLSDLSDWRVRLTWKTSPYTSGVQTVTKRAKAMGVSVSDLIEVDLQEGG